MGVGERKRVGEEKAAVGWTPQEDRGWKLGQILEKTHGV